MNPRQMALQIRHELRNLIWESGSLVFGDRGAFVFAGTPDEEQLPAGFPFCLVSIDGGTPDEDHPELIEQGFTLLTVANVAGDPLGEFAVIGGARADLGKSAGAGVAELAERVRSAVQNLLGIDGAKIMLTATTTGTPIPLGRGKHLAIDELGLTALCTSQPHYSAPQQVAVAGSAWTWEGDQCGDRFDFVQYRIGYVAGSTPPETPDDADAIVFTGTAPSATHAPSGGRAYAVFADYNSRGQSSVEGSSSGTEVGATHIT